MASLNKVNLIGHLGKDPETRTMQSGDKVVTMSLATSESWTDKASGQRKERTEWHRVAIFNQPLATIAERYLKKGSQIYIEGQLETRKYEKDGREVYTTEVVLRPYRGELVMLGGNTAPAEARQDEGQRTTQNYQPVSTAVANAAAGLDDDIPF